MVSVKDAGLNEILDDHAAWLRSRGSKDAQPAGKQADLSERVDLSEINFTNAWLSKAIFSNTLMLRCVFDKAAMDEAVLTDATLNYCSFAKTFLNSANLRGADLGNATFYGDAGGADLENADLRDANLTSAKLGNVAGLNAQALAGADLTLAELPNDIAEFKALDHVSEISRHARTNFLAVIAACVYCWLTIATTTDLALLVNSASTPLPIIQTPVPLAGFYWAAPLILLALYMYLHLYLQRMWEGLASLPARFPDGRSLDERAYPWLLTGLVRAYVPRLRANRPSMSTLQNGISILVAWGLVPLTLGLFWWRYLPRHDWWGTGLHIGVFAIAVSLGVVSFRLAGRTLENRDPLNAPPPPAWRFYRAGATEGGARWRGPAGSAAVLAAMAVLSVLAIDMPRTGIGVIDVALRPFGAPADLFEAEVTRRPAGWVRGRLDNTPPDRVRLGGASLRFANAEAAFLANADLSGADLSGAVLTGADLQDAVMRGAWMQGADLANASLVGADLRLANARFANLRRADLRNAVLSGVSLGSTDLEAARLNGADLADAGIRGSRLLAADLTDARLQGADFSRSDLTGARLVDATVSGAIFYGARLTDTDLTGADLTRADIAQSQLDQACGTRPPLLSPETGLRFTPRPCPVPLSTGS